MLTTAFALQANIMLATTQVDTLMLCAGTVTKKGFSSHMSSTISEEDSCK